MYYTTAREYAKLQGLAIRGPHSLMNSHESLKGMLFAKKQGLEVEYMKQIFDAGWPSGWRDFDMQSHAQLQEILHQIGADLSGFDEYMQSEGDGEQELQQCQRAAEGEGIVGVPHYTFDDANTGKMVGVFGREHLALIRSKLHAEGLAKHSGVSPECSHAFVVPHL